MKNIKITKTEHSTLSKLDFDNIPLQESYKRRP